MTIQTTLATGTEIVLLIIALGSAVGSYFLSRKALSTDTYNPFDNVLTTLTTKGEFLQYVIGRRRIAPYFFWAGDRSIIASGGGGGGKGGPSSSPSGQNYIESAGHLLALGPVDRLLAIYQEGKLIWSGDINRFSSPSGTRITVAGEGAFEIYWGELDQPVCAYLADASRIGIPSGYPYHCYVVWISKLLGSSARWPQLEYDIEASTYGSTLESSSRTFPSLPGVNPAHIVYQLTTGLWPHGASMDPSSIDFGELENVGLTLQDELLAFNLHIKQGTSVADVLAQVMQDAGLVLPQIGAKIVPVLIRTPASWPIFTSAHLTNPLPNIEIVHGEAQVDRVIYEFPDIERKFEMSPIQIDDDGEAGDRDNRKPVKIQLNSVISRAVAVKTADRRQSESFIQGSRFDLNMMFTARMLFAGMPFEVEGLGRLRCSSRLANTDDNSVVIRATIDLFGSYSGFNPEAILLGETGTGPAVDPHFKLMELPYGWSGLSQALLGLLRIRDNPSVGGAQLLISADNSTFSSLGVQVNWCRGGSLEAAIGIDDYDWLESSVVIQAYNSDMTAALDLSADATNHLAGKQMASINGELFFLQSVTALGSGRYRLNNLVRNCLGTARSAHAAGDTVYIFERNQIKAFTDPSLIPGRTIYYKSQPIGISAESVTSKSISLMGYASAPYCCTICTPLVYTDGVDTTFYFGTRVRSGAGRAAGEQSAGAVLTSTTPAPWFEGPIRVRIRSIDGTLVRTFTDSSTQVTGSTGNFLTVTYTSAQKVTDFTTEPDEFILEVASVLDERVSPYQQFIIRKDFV